MAPWLWLSALSFLRVLELKVVVTWPFEAGVIAAGAIVLVDDKLMKA